MHEYIVSRIYRLTGEYPSPASLRRMAPGKRYVEAVTNRIQGLRIGFERRASDDELRPQDRELMEKVVFLQTGDVGRSRLAARVARLRVSGVFSGSVRKSERLLEVIKAAIEIDFSIPYRLLRELEKHGIVDDEGEHYVIDDSMELKPMDNGSEVDSESEV